MGIPGKDLFSTTNAYGTGLTNWNDHISYNNALNTARRSGNLNRVRLLEEAKDAFVKECPISLNLADKYHVTSRLRNANGETVGIIARLVQSLDNRNIGKIFKFIR